MNSIEISGFSINIVSLEKCRKIWITGASGQLGSALIPFFEERTDWVVIYPKRDVLDLTNEQETRSFIQRERPDVVIHAAAYTAVEEAEAEQAIAFLMNGQSTQWIAEECNAYDAKLIYISTDYVFDGEKRAPYKEDDSVNPLNVYGLSKRKGELAVLANNNGLVIRASWIYSTIGKNFFKTMLRLAQSRSQLNVVNDQIGAPTYAKSFARDLSQWVFKMQSEESRTSSILLHYSPMGETTWFEFAKVFLAVLQPQVEVCPVDSASFPQKAKRPMYSKMSNENWVNMTGIIPANWEMQLSECIADWKKI